MEVIRGTHSCVRLEHDGRVLVIDPGIWSNPDEPLGADAVVLTHEHSDHADVLRLRGLEVPVFAPVGAALDGLEFTPIHSGQSFSAARFRLDAVGGEHAKVLAEQAPCANLGFIVEGGLYHPGDALHVPGVPVEILLVPLQAAWLKTSEAVDFVRRVGPGRAIGIHDGQVNERALASLSYWLAAHTGTVYDWLPPGRAV